MSSRCTLTDKSFSDDLSPYTLRLSKDNSLFLDYGDGSENTVSFNYSRLRRAIKTSRVDTSAEIWQPIFISRSTSRIVTKKVNRNFSVPLDNQLGIERFMSFAPKCNTWKLTNSMVVDWVLTDANFPNHPAYGLLGWIKYPQIYSFLLGPSNIKFNVVSSFSANSLSGKSYDFGTNDCIIKHNDDTFINVYGDSDTKFFSMSAFPGDDSVSPDYNSLSLNQKKGTGAQLYISDGDFFSHYESNTVQDELNAKGFGSDTFISATLWKDYQHIYNVLSKSMYDIMNGRNDNHIGVPWDFRKNEKYSKRGLDAVGAYKGKRFSSSQAKILRKIAGFFATHPLRDRITQECFSTPGPQVLKIYKALQQTEDEEGNPKPVMPIKNDNDEMNLLRDINRDFFAGISISGEEHSNNQVTVDPDHSNSIYGFINNPADLFNKLMYKYNPHILISNNSKITYKESIEPNIYINQVMTNHCSKGLSNDLVYNNMSLDFRSGRNSGYRFETNFNNKKTEYRIVVNEKGEASKKYNIPLFDIAKKFDLYEIDKDVSFSAGPDIHIPATIPDPQCGVPEKFNGFSFAPGVDRLTTGSFNIEHEIDLSLIQKILDKAGDTIPFYSIGSLEYKWTKQSGPQRGLSISDATEPNPKFKFRTFGKFTIALTVTLGELALKDTVDVYVVNKTGCNVGIDEFGLPAYKFEEKIIDPITKEQTGTRIVDKAVAFVPPNYYNTFSKSPVTFNRNREGELDKFIDGRRVVARIIPNDNNRSFVPNITQLMFSKFGAIQPVKSNSYVSVSTSVSAPNDDGQVDGMYYIGRLDGANKHNKFFYSPVKEISESATEFFIRYRPNNTVIKLYKINLERLRDRNHSGCKSVYRNLLYNTTRTIMGPNARTETRFDRDIPGQTDVFNEYEYNPKQKRGIRKSEVTLHPMPPLSDYGVNMSFGSIDMKDTLVTDVVGLKTKDLILPKANVDTVFGHPLNAASKVCYLREAKIYTDTDSRNDYPANNPNIRFSKGTFHPESGFIFNTTKEPFHNKTSALKFNPGDRTTFSFIGKGFYNTIRGDIDSQSSSISMTNSTLDVTMVDRPGGSVEVLQDTTDNDTIDVHHGYRQFGDPGLNKPKDYLLQDEFTSASYGGYDMGVRGRRIENKGGSGDGGDRIYGSNLLFPKIRNIEVKLNFLNQVNLKNTRISLNVRSCKKIRKLTEPEQDAFDLVDTIQGNAPEKKAFTFRSDPFNFLLSRKSSPVLSNVDKSNQGLKTEIKNSRSEKVNVPSNYMNHSGIAEYLEHLQYTNLTRYGTYTLNLLNEEHVDSNTVDTVLHFSDRFSKHLTPRNLNTNAGININQKVNTTNYIKLQPTLAISPTGYPHADEYITAIKNNDIFLPVNSFVQFYDQPVFQGALDITSEEGEIEKPDSETTFTLQISTFHDDDMTSLDTISNLPSKTYTDTTTTKPGSDSVFNSLCSWELILHFDTDDFTPTDNLGQIKYGWEPNIPGYNFISSDPNIEFKIPQAVQDAPNQKLADLNPCSYGETIDNSLALIRRPPELRFPSELIALGLAALTVGALGGIIGLSVGFGAFLSAMAGITRFLSSIKRARVAAALKEAFVRSVYTKRGFGGHDKILLQVGANGPFVYDVEAAIYKYSNTPLLKRKIRKYVKTNTIPELSVFPVVEEVRKLQDLFTGNVFSGMGAIEEQSLNIVNSEGLIINKLPAEGGLVDFNDNLYVAKQEGWELLNNTNIPLPVLCQNNVLSLDLRRLNNMCLIAGTRAYNYFQVGNTVQTLSGDEYIVKARGKILKDKKEYTVLEFVTNRPGAGQEIILKPEEDFNIIIWSDKESDHYNSRNPATPPGNTLFPKGAYGSATPVINSTTYSNQLQVNDVPTIFDIFNNQECNVKPNNRITLFSASSKYADRIETRKADRNFAYNLGGSDIVNNSKKEQGTVLQGMANGPTHSLTAGYSYNIYNILDPKDRLSSDYIYSTKDNNDSSVFNTPQGHGGSPWENISNNRSEKLEVPVTRDTVGPNNFEHLLNNVHNNGPDSPNIVELNNSDFKDIDNNGYLCVEGDYEFSYAYNLGVAIGKQSVTPVSFGNDASQFILSRLKFLDQQDAEFDEDTLYKNMSIAFLKRLVNTLPEDAAACFSASDYVVANRAKKCQKFNARNELSNLTNERNQLLNILDTVGIIYEPETYNVIYTPYGNADIRYHGTIIFNSTDNFEPIKIISYANTDIPSYWINIDPHQKCKTSKDSSIKILVEAKYTCFPTTAVVAGDLGVIPVLDQDAQNVCPSQARGFQSPEIIFDNAGNVFTYEVQLNEIARQKVDYNAKYGIGANQWEEITFPGPRMADGGGTATRSFFIRPDTNRSDILVEVTEKYLVPNEDFFDNYAGEKRDSDGNRLYRKAYQEYQGKVKDIIPESVLESDNLVCRSKVIPRKLRKLDTHYERYGADYNGNLEKVLPSIGPGGPFSNVLALWHCIDTNQLKHVPVPDYFKIKNEMIIRSYFGSKDNLEHIDDLDESKDPFEWIPYEYDPGYEVED
tara:strand:- start:504 stop:8042 length:7539 start_codon:yes stop_codon:yes gene_type:complete